MTRIWTLFLVCVLALGVAMAQSTSSQTSSSSSTQTQPQQTQPQQTQPSGSQQPQASDPNSGGQPAGSNAQATSDTSAQQQPQGQTSAPTRRGGGGVPLVWVLIGIAVVLALIFGLVGRGRSDSSVIVDRTDRTERIDRDRAA